MMHAASFLGLIAMDFGCHTDITIPYDELGSIIAYDDAGNSYPIIREGRFVLKGCEELNKPFEE